MNTSLGRTQNMYTYPFLSPLAQDVLRVVAIASMFADHANKLLLSHPLEALAVLGRLAFPLFCLLIAHNIHARGVPWRRYVAPLLLAGLAAQWPFMVLYQPLGNVMFTLLLGVLIEPASRLLERKLGPGAGAFAWLLVALPNLFVDYPLFGAWLVPLAGWVVRRGTWQAWIPFLLAALFTNQFMVQAFSALALPVLVQGAALLVGTRMRIPRFVWWAVYPAHLVVLALVRG